MSSTDTQGPSLTDGQLIEHLHARGWSVDAIDVAMIREACSALAKPWRPIETAPKDGTYVLLGSAKAGGSWVGKFEPQYQSGWRPENPWSSMMLNCWHLPNRYASLKPTHWQPLPQAPGIAGTAQSGEGVDHDAA